LTVEFELHSAQFVVEAVVLSEIAALAPPTPSDVAPVVAVDPQKMQVLVIASPRATALPPLVAPPVIVEAELQKAQFSAVELPVAKALVVMSAFVLDEVVTFAVEPQLRQFWVKPFEFDVAVFRLAVPNVSFDVD
jgi:hypothetical protein